MRFQTWLAGSLATVLAAGSLVAAAADGADRSGSSVAAPHARADAAVQTPARVYAFAPVIVEVARPDRAYQFAPVIIEASPVMLAAR
jgi:hypothetical protein